MGPANCDRMRECVSLGLDGELSLYESSALERHLLRCPACADFADSVRGYTELLRVAPLEEAPRFALPRRRRALRVSVGVGAAVASTAAAALVALSFTKPSGDHGQAAPLSFAPSAAVVERAPGGSLVGLRHPSAARVAPAVEDLAGHGVFRS